MKIETSEITLINFKGISKLVVQLPQNTRIYGPNKTGKTTIKDAFHWLIFGKDSSDRTDFNIKPLDENNKVTHNTETEVSAKIMVDGSPLELKRILKEEWQKPRGEEVEVFKGNKTLFWVDGVPVKSNEYTAKIDAIVKESLFKLLTNPNYFNSLHWEKQRSALYAISGADKMTPASILGDTISEYSDIIAILESEGQTNTHKSKLNSKIKDLKEETKQIPTRIDEIKRNTPQKVDEVAIQSEIQKGETTIENCDKKINNSALAYNEANDNNQKIQNKIFETESSQSQIVNKIKIDNTVKEDDSEANKSTIESDIEILETRIRSKELQCENIKSATVSFESQAKQLKEEFGKESKKEFVKSDDITCPTCKQPLPDDSAEEKLEELKTNFNFNKRKILDKINLDGKNATQNIDSNKDQLKTIEKDISDSKERLTEKNNQLKGIVVPQKKEAVNPIELAKADTEYIKLSKEIEALKKRIKPLEKVDVSEIIAERKIISQNIETLKEKLMVNKSIEKSNERTTELMNRQKECGQQMAKYEKELFKIEKFVKRKVSMIEATVNGMFMITKFKLFETQVNGSQIETCQAMYKGVPFKDLNTASKVNVGLDIIKTLSKFYNTYCPIFIDNAESTNQFLKMDSQVIKLFVIEPCPTPTTEKPNAIEEYVNYYESKGKLLI